MAYDGSIRINTKIDGKGFNTGIKGMMASLGSLAAAIGVAFSVQQVVQFGKKSVETAMQMEAGWQGLRYMANAYGKDLNHIKEFLNEFTEDGLVPMMNAQQAYKNMLARGYSTDQLEKMLLIMKDSSVYLRKGQLDIGDAIEKTTMGLRTERSILTDSAGIEKNMYKMWQAYAKEIGTTISALTHEQKLIAEFQGFMEEGAIYAGAAAEYTETYAGKVTQLTAAMVGLKVSVGNMIIPLLNAILPKIIAMVKWFTYWFNIIGRVLNLLFGTNVGASAMDGVADDASDAADAQDELANATERAGKAAKGALASFDKLNVLAQDTSGGGGGGGVGDVGLPVEEEQDGGALGKMGKAIDELDEKLAAFKEKLLGIFDMIKDAFKTGDFSTLAQTLSNGIIGALESAREAIQGFDFKQFGTDIGSGFNNIVASIGTFINNIDTLEIGKQFGGLVSDWWKGIHDTISGFLQEVDWQEVGNTIWTAFVKAFEFVKGFVEGFDWSGTVSSIFESLGSAIGAATALIVTLGTKIWEALKEAWNTTKEKWASFKDETGGDIWGGILEGIKNAATNISNWVKENIVDPFVKGFKKAFGIASPSTVMEEQGGYIIDGLKQGIEDAWNNIGAWFDEKVKQPVSEWFTGLWDDIKKWAEDAWSGITDAWSGAETWFSDKVIEPLKGWFSEAWEDIKGFASEAWTDIEETWSTVSTWFNDNVTEPVKTFFSDAWDDIKGFFTGAWDDIKAVWDDVAGWFNDNVINPIIGFINRLIGAVETAVNWIVGGLNKISFDIPAWLGGGTFGINLTPVSFDRIPALATGAVIPANAPFAAILGDQKSGTNIEAPLKTIENAVENVLARRGLNTGADNGLIHNVIKLDGQVLYEAVKKIDRRVGTSLISGSGIR